MKSHGGGHRNGRHLVRLRVLALAAALDDGAEMVENIPAGLAILQAVPGDLGKGVIEEALEYVVHDQVAARYAPIGLVTGPLSGLLPHFLLHP